MCALDDSERSDILIFLSTYNSIWLIVLCTLGYLEYISRSIWRLVKYSRIVSCALDDWEYSSFGELWRALLYEKLEKNRIS